ncbi:MAG: CdvA-like protein [Candidatus Bathyarchaeia archaeon]|nr:CdvA-like protein [Candidatus Bathyarchaeota archaeon]
MDSSMDRIKRFIGKTVYNIYGREIGRLVGLTSDIKGDVDSVSLELGHGEFETYPGKQVSIEGDKLVLINDWSVESGELARELDLLLRRDRALNELYSSGDIDEATCSRLKEQYRKVRDGLLKNAEDTVRKLIVRSQRLEEQIKLLQSIMANNKMHYTSGEINEEEYCLANESIQKGLQRFIQEKRDIEERMNSLIAFRDTAEDLGELKRESAPVKIASQPVELTKTGGTRDIVIVKMEP